MNNIKINGKSYNAPSEWNELNQAQLINWLKIIDTKIEDEQALRLAAMSFYKIKKQNFFELNSAQQIQLIGTLTFLLDSNKLVKWLLPDVTTKLRRYLGPSHRFTTSSIKEFRTAELYYNTFLATGDDAALDMLFATLYRSAGSNHPDNDLRELVTELGVQRRAHSMSKLDKYLRKAILFNYEGCRAYVIRKYPEVFKSGPATVGTSIPDLEGIIKTVAGSKFGTFKETETTPLYLFLDHLSDEIEAVERLKRK